MLKEGLYYLAVIVVGWGEAALTWTQVIDPMGNPGLSALVAAVPVIFLFVAMAGLLTVSLAVVIASTAFAMPVWYALQSTLYGALYGPPAHWLDCGSRCVSIQHNQ